MPTIPENFTSNIETVRMYIPELYRNDLLTTSAMLTDQRDVSLAAVNDFIVERCQDRLVNRGLFVAAQNEVGIPRAMVSQNWGRFMRSVCLFYPHFIVLKAPLQWDTIAEAKERIGLDACTALVTLHVNETMEDRAVILGSESEADAVALRLALDL